MKHEFRAHPLMVFRLIRPFWFVLVLPLVKGLVQYLISRRVTGVLGLEIAAFLLISAVAGLRCASFRLLCGENSVTVRMGVLFRTCSVIPLSGISSVRAVTGPIDALCRAVTYQINTEAGKRGKTDFSFELSRKDSELVSGWLIGAKTQKKLRFSAVRVAAMAATTSSAVTGMIVAVPIINKAGKLLGLALERMVFDEINHVSEQTKTLFPPIVNAITLLFLLAYGVSFLYLFVKNLRFELLLNPHAIEVRSGLIWRRRAAFRKDSVNVVKIEQTPLMRLFDRYVMKAGVGGYGDTRAETPVIVPSGRRGEIMLQARTLFPGFESHGRPIRAARGKATRRRFLFPSRLYGLLLAFVSAVTALIFPDFGRLILFLFLVGSAVLVYAGYLGVYISRFGRVKLGEACSFRGTKGFRVCEMLCPKEKIGELKITRIAPDRKYGTCNFTVVIRSEAADSLTVRHLPLETVKSEIEKNFGIEWSFDL